MHYKVTEYGFEWGALRVQRRASDRGYVVLGLDAGKHRIDVLVSPTGRSVRIVDWNTGKAWKPAKGEQAVSDTVYTAILLWADGRREEQRRRVFGKRHLVLTPSLVEVTFVATRMLGPTTIEYVEESSRDRREELERGDEEFRRERMRKVLRGIELDDGEEPGSSTKAGEMERLRAELEAARRVIDMARRYRAQLVLVRGDELYHDTTRTSELVAYTGCQPPTGIDPLAVAIADYDREFGERGGKDE